MTQKKRPSAAQILEAIREEAARLRQQKEEKKEAIKEQRRLEWQRRKAQMAKAPKPLRTSILHNAHIRCDHRVCMCNVNGYCGHLECPTGKRITP